MGNVAIANVLLVIAIPRLGRKNAGGRVESLEIIRRADVGPTTLAHRAETNVAIAPSGLVIANTRLRRKNAGGRVESVKDIRRPLRLRPATRAVTKPSTAFNFFATVSLARRVGCSIIAGGRVNIADGLGTGQTSLR